MFALGMTTFTQMCCRNSAQATVQIDECTTLAEEKGVAIWQMQTMAHRGCVLALVGKSAEAIQTIRSGIDGWRSIGATVLAQFWLSLLALAYAKLEKLMMLALHQRGDHCSRSNEGEACRMFKREPYIQTAAGTGGE